MRTMYSDATTTTLRRLSTPPVTPHRLPLRHVAPLYWEQNARLWVCTGYALAETILCDTRGRFGAKRLPSNEQLRVRGLEQLIPVYALLQAQMLFQDDPAHRRLRTALQKRFTAMAVGALQARVQALVDEQLAPYRYRPYMDLIADFAGPLPTKLSAELLGLPLSDLARFMRWNEAYERLLASFPGPPVLRDERILESLEEEVAYFLDLIGMRRTALQDDLLSDLIRAFLGDLGTSAADETSLQSIVANAIMLLAGGYTTTTNLISEALLWLWRKPDQRHLLEADPALIESVISETMRLSGSSQYVVRQALQDVVIGAKRIRRGQHVLILLAAANLDERVFPHPREFTLKRSSKQKHLGFSRGHHYCMGAPYAELLARIAIPTFLRYFPAFQVIEDALAWGSHPHVRCLRRAPLLLGPESREDRTNGVPLRANFPLAQSTATLDLPTSDATTIRFDPTQAMRFSFAIGPGYGSMTITKKPSEEPQDDLLAPLLEEQTTVVLVGQQLKQIFATVLDISPDRVNDRTDFFEAGGDSLSVAALLTSIEQHLQVELDPAVVYGSPMLADLAVVLTRQRLKIAGGEAVRPMTLSLSPAIWVHRPYPLTQPGLRLFCLPYAGGDASLFRAWSQDLPADLQAAVEICPIQLPGRAHRLQEPLYTSIAALVDTLVPATLQESPLFPYLDRSFAFFGVCLGALIGFELAQALANRHGLLARALVSAACRAPHLPSPYGPAGSAGLSDADLVELIRSYGGTPEHLLTNEKLMRMLLPKIRSDLLMSATYACPPDVVLNCPIVACGATEDGLISLDDLAAWQRHTRKSFSLYTFSGDHFFLRDAPQIRARLVECLSRTLRTALDSPEIVPLLRYPERVARRGGNTDGSPGTRAART